jgi:hypothetical protein
MVERIASEYSGPDAGPSDRVLRRELIAGQPWAGFLGAVEVAITREAETGGGLFYATGSATVCVRFEIHGENGPAASPPARLTAHRRFRPEPCPPASLASDAGLGVWLLGEDISRYHRTYVLVCA